MTPSPKLPTWVHINQVVEEFEAARFQQFEADLADFLPDPEAPNYLTVLTELIRVDMEYRWRDGRCQVEEYLHRFPVLRDAPGALRQIALEEFRLRQNGGEEPRAAEYQTRLGLDPAVFSPTHEETSSLPPTVLLPAEAAIRSFEPGRAEQSQTRQAAPAVKDGEGSGQFAGKDGLLEPGSDVCGFRLLTELGRGSFSRVFLAREGALAGRVVVLKIAKRLLGESQTLAQLQHTHIVPIHSVHRFHDLEAICMPYFGALTLQHLVDAFSGQDQLPQSGLALVTTLGNHLKTLHDSLGAVLLKEGVVAATFQSSLSREVFAPGPEPAPASAQHERFPLRFLEHLHTKSYEETVLWLGACLANGLAHAHKRGILHLDLKPANILVTEDGLPMLLDFNLAYNTEGGHPDHLPRIGGTVPYMSPEQFQSCRDGIMQVDARSDIYSLGIILFQLLTGKFPFPTVSLKSPEQIPSFLKDRSGPPPRVRTVNSEVSLAMEAILYRCLQANPADRYASADQLAEDLQRQFDQLPLKHTREPSFREHARKWARRHPRLVTAGLVVLAASLLLGLLGYAFLSRGQRLDQLEREKQLAAFRDDLQTVRYLVNAPALSRTKLEEGLQLCRANLDRVGVFDRPAEQAAPPWLPEEERLRFRKEVGEQLYWLVRTSRQLWELGKSSGSVPPAQDWLDWNQRALACFAEDQIPVMLLRQRQELLALHGDIKGANRLADTIGAATPRSATDLYLSAVDLSQQGKLGQAQGLLHDLLRQQPDHFWGWILAGYCHDEKGAYHDSAACFSTAVALKPNAPWAYYLRGMAHLMEKSNQEAVRDFTIAIEKRANWWEPCHARSVAHQRLKQYDKAVVDLTRALETGGPPAKLHFLRSRAHQLWGKTKEAEADLELGLKSVPADELDWVARGLARQSQDPKAALEDFEQALRLNPRCQSALQNKAVVLARYLKQPEEALAALDRVVALYPEYLRGRGGKAVLLARMGLRQQALQEVHECLTRNPDPEILFQMGSVLALTSVQVPADADRALELLRSALQKGWGQEHLLTDPDLNPIRSHPEFRQLLQAVALLHKKHKTASGLPKN
jgi:serine/threonine protein kinase/tetratricopeptide (TPR) repeat protein